MGETTANERASGETPLPPGAAQTDPAIRLEEVAVCAENFADLYRRHVAVVYRYFYHQVGNQADAEDLTAATFSQALASLGNYRESGMFRAWLFGIAHHILGTQRRTRPTGRVEDLPVHPVDSDRGPEWTVMDAEETAHLKVLLRQLPADQREAVALRFFGELSTRETAAALGRSEGSVKMLVHRAITALRNAYRSEEP